MYDAGSKNSSEHMQIQLDNSLFLTFFLGIMSSEKKPLKHVDTRRTYEALLSIKRR